VEAIPGGGDAAMKLKVVVLYCLRAAGVFALCRSLTRSKLRILCYHGFAVGDQHEFSPALYMKPRTFEARLRTLQRLGYPVVSLQRGLALLSRNEVANCETVITIDDGWRTTYSLAAPILKSLSFGATIYVTSYYSERGTDVFNVALHYLMWRTLPQSVVVTDFDPRIDGTYQSPHGPAAIAAAIIRRAETHLQAPDRQRLLEYLVATVGLPHGTTLGQFRLISPAEIAELAAAGFDIQLHTHRHRLSMDDRDEVAREIADNRQRLESWINAPARHFCYPSGKHAQQHPAWLRELGVESATTCEPGLNDQATDPYRLRRFLDSEAFAEIEFEAELSGLGSVLRRLNPRSRRGGHPRYADRQVDRQQRREG
jgi:peptidoglycan/xylan/chitin deacetylase (PgdA/CDA1 family)